VPALSNDHAVHFPNDGLVALLGLLPLVAQLIEMLRHRARINRRIGERRIRRGRSRSHNRRRRARRLRGHLRGGCGWCRRHWRNRLPDHGTSGLSRRLHGRRLDGRCGLARGRTPCPT